jgi:hypothetical protein
MKIMKQTIDTYRLTSMEEPSDEILSQLMKEAAEDARVSGEKAHREYFNHLDALAKKVLAEFKAKYPEYATK